MMRRGKRTLREFVSERQDQRRRRILLEELNENDTVRCDISTSSDSSEMEFVESDPSDGHFSLQQNSM